MVDPPKKTWWINITKSLILKELEQRPDIMERLGYYHNQFVNWSARCYCALKPDLDNDVIEFEDSIVTRRLEYVNVKVYYELRDYIFTRDNYTCTYCQQVGHKLELDHIIPLSKGGTSLEENLTTACFKCNRQKRDKSVEEFMSWRVLHFDR